MRQNNTITSRRGISPLIAAVLLIAFTMAVAAILTAWVTTFTEDVTEDVSNESDQLIQCSYAGVSIYDANHDTGSEQVDVTVANTGTVDLNNVSVYSFRDAAIQEQDSIANLDAGSLGTATLTEIGANETPERVQAISEECSSARAESTDISTS